MKIRAADSRIATSVPLARRTFVKGLAWGGLLAGSGMGRRAAWALTSADQRVALTGTEFELAIDVTPVNFTGRPRTAITVNGSLPAPILRWREGDTVSLRVA